MIDGFKLKITAAELRKHCTERSEYHGKRADEKAAELPELQATMQKVKKVTAANLEPQELAHMNKTGSYSNMPMDTDEPIEQLERAIKNHRNHALVFAFFAAHLFDEDYTLLENDLRRLEILR